MLQLNSAGREEFATMDVRVSYRTRVYSDAHPDITRGDAVYSYRYCGSCCY